MILGIIWILSTFILNILNSIKLTSYNKLCKSNELATLNNEHIKYT